LVGPYLSGRRRKGKGTEEFSKVGSSFKPPPRGDSAVAGRRRVGGQDVVSEEKGICHRKKVRRWKKSLASEKGGRIDTNRIIESAERSCREE